VPYIYRLTYCLSFALHVHLSFFFWRWGDPRDLPSFPTRRSSDLVDVVAVRLDQGAEQPLPRFPALLLDQPADVVERVADRAECRSEEHTSELQSQSNLVCRLLLEKKNASLTYK